MLDTKILAAVFIGLTAVAVTTGGSAEEEITSDTPDIDGIDSGFLGSGSLIDSIRNYFESDPDANTDFEAELIIEDIESVDIEVSNATVTVAGMEELDLEANRMVSNQQIYINRFDGDLELGDTTRIHGFSQDINSSDVRLTGHSSINHRTNSTSLLVENTSRTDIEFVNVTGQMHSDGSTTNLDESTNLEIKSFEGDITVDISENTVMLEGVVARASSGDFVIGG